MTTRESSDAGERPRARNVSLSTQYVGLILAIVLALGLTLGGVVTVTSVRSAAEERLASIEYASSVAAGALMPVLADQDPMRTQAQLESILSVNEGLDIECIEIIDAEGNIIAESEPECTCDLVPPSESLMDVFTKPQVSRVPIVVDGLTVATVSIQFRPVGLERAVVEPLSTTLLALLLAMLVAALWGGWLVLKTVVEPIGTLRDAAESIASGRRDVDLEQDRRDEIGELARSLHDMTSQLQDKERQLIESYGSLQDAYHNQADLSHRLERTMALKSDFVAVASHELRSPLAVVLLYSEMLEDNEFGDLDPGLAEAVEAIVGAVSRLSSIVSSLMDVALLERGLMPLEYSMASIDDVVEQAAEDAAALAARSGIKVVIEGRLPEVSMHADPIRIRQAVDNLLSNAIKYSEPPATVRVLMTADDDTVDITVLDEGRGVDPECADVLFELFGRGDASDNTRVYGLGLGLPISDRIVKAHGGEITFEPNPAGKGTAFHILLPREVAHRQTEIRVVEHAPGNVTSITEAG